VIIPGTFEPLIQTAKAGLLDRVAAFQEVPDFRGLQFVVVFLQPGQGFPGGDHLLITQGQFVPDVRTFSPDMEPQGHEELVVRILVYGGPELIPHILEDCPQTLVDFILHQAAAELCP
jgi:hypothetical protein